MNTQYDHLIQRAVELHLPLGYDWRLFKAQLWQESRLNPNAESSAGAVGIGQIVEDTFEMFAPKAGFDITVVDRTDPEASIYTAALYLDWLIEEWSWPRPEMDRWCLAMASYNAGLGHILAAQRKQGMPSSYAEIIVGLPEITGPRHSKETIDYVGLVLGFCSTHILSGDYEI